MYERISYNAHSYIKGVLLHSTGRGFDSFPRIIQTNRVEIWYQQFHIVNIRQLNRHFLAYYWAQTHTHKPRSYRIHATISTLITTTHPHNHVQPLTRKNTHARVRMCEMADVLLCTSRKKLRFFSSRSNLYIHYYVIIIYLCKCNYVMQI